MTHSQVAQLQERVRLLEEAQSKPSVRSAGPSPSIDVRVLWLDEHPEVLADYAGKRIAVTEKGVVESDEAYGALHEKLRARGILDQVLIVRVPAK